MMVPRSSLRSSAFAWITVWLASAGIVSHSHAQDGPTAAELVARGESKFLAGEIKDSVKAFELAIELQPRLRPQLWQLGISYYYAEDFEAGRRLFEDHQRVNRNDVENAAWHFLCVARIDGVDAARRQLLEIDTRRDSRVPMTEVYELYAGRGTVEAVLAAAKEAGTQRASMYAHLYLGLYYEISKQPKLCREHLQKSAAATLRPNYMQAVANVHLQLLERNSKKTP